MKPDFQMVVYKIKSEEIESSQFKKIQPRFLKRIKSENDFPIIIILILSQCFHFSSGNFYKNSIYMH